VGGKFEGSKSYDMQTISTILVELQEVTTLARFLHFLRPQGTPKILWFFHSLGSGNWSQWQGKKI